MDRHVIANMGAELGATTTVFPADDAVRGVPARRGPRATTSPSCAADPDAAYDLTDEIDLSALEPLIARPSSPGNVVPVREVAGEPVDQVVIGSSANPGLRDFADRRRDRRAAARPTTRCQLRRQPDLAARSSQDLTAMGATFDLIAAGARIHQAGCMGCIGMGQAPATGRNSPAHLPAQLPRPLRHRGGRGLAVLPGDRRGRPR